MDIEQYGELWSHAVGNTFIKYTVYEEGWPSGLRRRFAKPLGAVKAPRGFESHSFRIENEEENPTTICGMVG